MYYTVKELLESKEFPGMRLIGGEAGIHRKINGVRIIEVSDMGKFLGGVSSS